MNKYFKEPVLWALMVLPYVYLATIWSELPDRVPTHFTIDGTANDWSNKTTLLYIPGALCLGIYLLMLVVPILDPKRKIQQMGDKYYTLRFIITLFISLISTYILLLSKGDLNNPKILLGLLGALLAVSGSLFKTISPNYFLGIRTPWTLENEQVWKKNTLARRSHMDDRWSPYYSSFFYYPRQPSSNSYFFSFITCNGYHSGSFFVHRIPKGRNNLIF